MREQCLFKIAKNILLECLSLSNLHMPIYIYIYIYMHYGTTCRYIANKLTLR